MYCHNFIRIDKDKIKSIDEIIREETEFRRCNEQDVIQVEVFDCKLPEFTKHADPEYVDEQIIMYAGIDDVDAEKNDTELSVHTAESPDDFEIGKCVDIAANGNDFGLNFTKRRYERRQRQYSNPESGIKHFICYRKDEYYGQCDLFISGKYGKIEDFDVIEKHQRKGYGSGILASIKEYAREMGVTVLFLQVESDNSDAVRLYERTGFKPLFNNLLYNREFEL